jgi:hypothetical protein
MKLLERKIIQFVRKIDPSVSVVFHDGEMESDNIARKIYINLDEFLCQFSDEQNHLTAMRENGLIIDILLPTYILLHELGHTITFAKYKAKYGILRQYSKQVDRIADNYEGLEALRLYKQLKLEKDADEFAYKFYLHNYEFVKAFDQKVRELIL